MAPLTPAARSRSRAGLATTAAPTRNRAVSLEGSNSEAVKLQLEMLITKSLSANSRKNAAAKEEKDTDAEISKLMAEHGMKQSEIVAWQAKRWQAKVAPGTKKEVNKKALAKKISYDDFVELASVAQGSVKDKYGTNMLDTVLDTVPTPEKLSIDEIKGA